MVTTLDSSTVKGDSLTVACPQLMRLWRLVAAMLRFLWVSFPYLTQRVLSPVSLSPVLKERVFSMANSILLVPPGEEVCEDVVGVGVPGAPFDPGLHELLENLGQLSEQLKLLQHMVRPVQPVIMPLKDEILC